MDALDVILLKAWNCVSKRVREKRVSALKRSRRRFRGVLTRPMREWCLVIRASDTRITLRNARIDPVPAGTDENADLPLLDFIARREPHMVTLSGSLIRELTKPISIPWPGVTYHEAAKICGRDYKTFKNWVRSGMFQIELRREFRFPEGCRRSGKICEMARGKSNRLPARPAEIVEPSSINSDSVSEASQMWAERFTGGGRPYVWTNSPIDPNNFEGRAPHPVWGTLWQWLWQDLPEDYELEVKRVPILRNRLGKEKFSGWDFICPGRLDENGELKGCGRRCRYLYGPQSVWTLAKAMGIGSGRGFEMPEDSGLAGEWYPGLSDPIRAAALGGLTFACKTCWGVRSACMANSDGWNDFIAQISGGLLYGRDVPRPLDICPKVRKKRPYKWKKVHPRKGRSESIVKRYAVAS